jgi:hypothetical protein
MDTALSKRQLPGTSVAGQRQPPVEQHSYLMSSSYLHTCMAYAASCIRVLHKSVTDTTPCSQAQRLRCTCCESTHTAAAWCCSRGEVQGYGSSSIQKSSIMCDQCQVLPFQGLVVSRGTILGGVARPHSRHHHCLGSSSTCCRSAAAWELLKRALHGCGEPTGCPWA